MLSGYVRASRSSCRGGTHHRVNAPPARLVNVQDPTGILQAPQRSSGW
uniref:Uncharacterized protein n=1 Tax=Arundo donax TaxID=35708 RepID=A0A0A8ZE12_ARUDO